MKKYSYLLVIALAALLGALAASAFKVDTAERDTDPAPSLDQREVVHFDEPQAQFALARMRGLLETLVSLDEAEAKTDFEAMANAAALQSPGRTAEHPDGFHDAMPDGFRSMSQQMRKGFKQAADAAEAGDFDAYYRAKRQVQSTCVACHETYRIPAAP